MSEIKRWDHDYLAGGPTEEADGDYILHSDHEAEVARLRAEVAGLELERDGLIELANRRANCVRQATGEYNRLSAEADALRAEVEAYRKDA